MKQVRNVLLALALLPCLLTIQAAHAQVPPNLAGLAGRWVGKGRGIHGYTWDFEVIVDAKGHGTATYGRSTAPANNCTLIRVDDAVGLPRFRETSATNPDDCNTVFELERETASRMAFRRFDADGTTLNATGELVLTPSSPPIVVDGAFGDWDGVPVAYRAPATFGEAFHVTAMRAAADERFLFLQLDFNAPVNVLALGRSLSVLLDADGDPATGRTIYGLPGVDLAVEMSPAPSEDTGAVVHWIPGRGGDIVDVSPNAIDLLVAPSYATSRVEMRLDRGVVSQTAGRTPLLVSAGVTLKFVLLNQDLIARLDYGAVGNVRQQSSPVSLTLPPFVPARTPNPAERIPMTDPLARAPGTDLRVAVWNVSGIPLQRRDSFANVLRAIDADILMLNETRERMSAAELEQWLSTVTPTNHEAWHVLAGHGTMVAARSEVAETFGPLTYSTAEASRLLPAAPPLDQRTSPAASVETNSVSTAGARVTLNGHHLLVVPLQLVCCDGSPNSMNEASRIIEARRIRSAVSESVRNLRPGATLVAGDLNLVATRGPLDTLRGSGADVAAQLEIASALQLNGQSVDTWRALSATGPYPPARMDWLLYSGPDLEQLGGFAFDARDLSPFWLGAHGLQAADSRASDHLPIVADFRWRR